MPIYKSLVRKVSIPAQNKIKQKDYLTKGTYPVIDQGHELIGGYTDDPSKLVRCRLPVIVFGDHTKAVKYITFPFAAGADGIKVLEVAEGIDPRFLFYATKYLTYKIENKGYARHYQFVEKKGVSIPELPEQQRIVARIEELFSQLDDAEATLQKTKAQLAVYRNAVLNEAFSDKENLHSLDSYLKQIESGKSFRCEERPPKKSEYGVIKVSAVTWGEFDENESKTCTHDQFDESKRISNGDFLFSRANTIQLVGNCVIVKRVNKNLMLSDKILRFGFKGEILPQYVLYFLRSPFGRHQIQEFSTGNQESMRNIPQQSVRKIKIPVVDEIAQKRIVDYIEGRLSECESISKTVDKLIMLITALRQSILKQSFGGEH